MPVDLEGRVVLTGESQPGFPVRVLADGSRLRVTTDDELVGDWDIHDIGIRSRSEGFLLKVEGEEFELHTSDDAALADELGLATLSPRLARLVAARHNPVARPLELEEPPPVPNRLAALGVALSGALVILGGSFLAPDDSRAVGLLGALDADNFWGAFLVGGALMIAAAFIMSIGLRFARVVAMLLLLAIIVVFGLSASGSPGDTSQVTAYGFIAGGVVIGVAVLAAGSLRDPK